MRKLTRLAIIGGASALALAISAPAFAAYTPKLDVSVPNGLGASGRVKIHFAVGPTDDTTARLVAYTPARFAVSGGNAGLIIGTVQASVRAGDLGGAIVPVPGEIDVRPSTGTALVSGVPVPLSQLALSCTGTTTHTAYWVFRLTAAGNALELAAFFDMTTGAEQALGASKITFCLPPDDVPAGTPGRSPLGIKLIDAVLTFNAGIIRNPSTAGQYLWTSIWTPYNPSVGTANVAGTVSAVSATPLPVALTLRGSYSKATQVGRAGRPHLPRRAVPGGREAADLRRAEKGRAQAIRLDQRDEGDRRVHGHQEDGADDLLPGALRDPGSRTAAALRIAATATGPTEVRDVDGGRLHRHQQHPQGPVQEVARPERMQFESGATSPALSMLTAWRASA